MILRGIDFGHVWQASGATNFYEQGWWYHRWLKRFGLDFSGSTFVSKTTTFRQREGNMPLKEDGVSPRELFPRCIHVNRRTKAAINAVSLSGPGIYHLLESGRWQKRTSPFFISIMSLEASAMRRLKELRECARMIGCYRSDFRSPFGIQVNFSCPNGGVDPADLVNEVQPALDAVAPLGVPTVAKFGPDLSVEAALGIEKHPALDAFCVFNTIPWDTLPDHEKIRYFGSTTSPLVKHLGEQFKGGVSGAPLRGRLLEWVHDARKKGLKKPINAGGGILSPNDAKDAIKAGADSISLGSIAFLAPTRVKDTIRAAATYCRHADTVRNEVSFIGPLS